MIKTILFDLNNVLISYKETEETYSKFKDKFNIDIKTFRLNGKEYFYEALRGNLSEAEFFEKTFEKLNIDKKHLPGALKLHQGSFQLFDGIIEVLEELSNKFNLILFTGESKDALEYKTKNFNLDKYFPKVYATCFHNTTKIEDKLYKIILEKENLNPKETLFIDDQPKFLNIAKNLGIPTLQFTSVENLKEDLKKLNLM